MSSVWAHKLTARWTDNIITLTSEKVATKREIKGNASRLKNVEEGTFSRTDWYSRLCTYPSDLEKGDIHCFETEWLKGPFKGCKKTSWQVIATLPRKGWLIHMACTRWLSMVLKLNHHPWSAFILLLIPLLSLDPFWPLILSLSLPSHSLECCWIFRESYPMLLSLPISHQDNLYRREIQKGKDSFSRLIVENNNNDG